MNEAIRGEIWDYDPDPVRGREQGYKIRPGLIVSSDFFNRSPAELVMIIPLTTRDREIGSHIRIAPEDGPVRKVSFAMCEQIRAISKEQLVTRWGLVKHKAILQEIVQWLSDLLELEAV